jgi:hypothetical protein
MRGSIYALNNQQYAAMPQFTGMPTFGIFQSHHPPVLSSGVSSPNITAQVQQFQRRQEQLMASTQRRIQQEVEWARRHGNYSDHYLASLQQPTPTLVDPYHHRSSLPVNFESSAHETVTRSLEHNSNMQQQQQQQQRQQQYRDTQLTESGVAEYNYVQEISHSLPFAAALATTLFRHPSAIEMEQRRKSGPPITLSPRNRNEVRIHDPNLTALPTVESTMSSDTSLPLKTTNSHNSLVDDHSNTDSIDDYKTPVWDEDQHETIEIKSKAVDVDEEAATESFPGLDKMFDAWDAADNEWLYSLQTECARPGAVCECGDSCCCPGCFTHTNNPGDRGVYNTMLNKLGEILETEKEEQESQHDKPCISTSTKSLTSNPDAKS